MSQTLSHPFDLRVDFHLDSKHRRVSVYKTQVLGILLKMSWFVSLVFRQERVSDA